MTDSNDGPRGTGWNDFLDLYHSTANDSLVDSERLDFDAVKQRLIELLEAGANGRLVRDGEVRWLAGCIEKGVFPHTDFASWVAHELAPFDFLNVDLELWSPVWRGSCSVDELSFLGQHELIDDDALEVEIHSETIDGHLLKVYRTLHRIDLILDQCVSLISDAMTKPSVDRDWEVFNICFNVNINGKRVNQLTLAEDSFPRISFVFDDEGTVLRRRTSTEMDSSKGADPFSSSFRRWHHFAQVLEHQESLSENSLIDTTAFDAATIQRRIDELTRAEKDLGIVFFGEKQWLMSNDGAPPTSGYLEWTLHVLNQFVFPGGGIRPNSNERFAATQDLYFVTKFDQPQQNSRVLVNRLCIKWASFDLVNPISLFHTIHNLQYLIHHIESMPEFSEFLDEASPAQLKDIRVEDNGEVSINIANEYGGEITYSVPEEYVFARVARQ